VIPGGRSAARATEDSGARRSTPTILDVLAAVKRVSAGSPHIDVWWLGARSGLHVGADPGQAASVDLVVDGRPLDGTAHAQLERALSRALGGAPVTLRFARSPADTRSLFRLLTARTAS
jgi:hypothetical protein